MPPESTDLHVDALQRIARCAAGDQAACAELVKEYGRMVGTIILRVTRTPSMVEDLTQEAFLRVFRALPDYEGRSKLSTWICTVAQRVALDELRRIQRRPRTTDAPADFDPADTCRTEGTVEQDDSDALVLRAVNALPDKYRLPLLYSAIEGLDYETISTMLNMPTGTVKTNVFRGKQMMRERLAPALFGDNPP